MSFEEPNNPRSSEIGNNQIQLTEVATYEERTPAVFRQRGLWLQRIVIWITFGSAFDIFAINKWL